MSNLILNTDSYKLSHFRGYPKGTTEMYSYLESRGGEYEDLVFIGLKPILDMLEQGIDAFDIQEAVEFGKKHGIPINKEGWDYILYELGGNLPIEIKALPEGTIVSPGVPMVTIRNTDPKCAWLTSYLETLLLRIWYPITVASRILRMKRNIAPYFRDTTDSGEVSPFAILDFSSRGVSSKEQSEIGGLAYLAHFQGSDNIPAVDFVNKTYNSEMSGFSVPATEHSIMCAFGQENEKESFEYLIDNMGEENGILSVVSDTWNIYDAVLMWIDLAPKIREKNLTLVIRPDSGEIDEVLPWVLAKLLDKWPYQYVNSKGYVVFENLKILWGDGINERTGHLPFEIGYNMGISADSIMTGSGGGLMQSGLDRDTAKFAIKGSNVIVNGKSIPISKNPITDKGKRSKSGKFDDPRLITVFKDGYSMDFTTIEDIRERLKDKY